MEVIYILSLLVQSVVWFNLVFPILLLTGTVLRKRSKSQPAVQQENVEADYAIIITAYGQASQVPSVLGSIEGLRYDNYRVYVVADNCDVSMLTSTEKVAILVPDVVLANNVKSHFYAIDRFDRAHERLVIIDSDNLVHPELLWELNRCFDQGYRAVQGLRAAKNLDTLYACLDAARDIYYHYFDGKKLFEAGSSATLSGSGMAFDVQLYRESLGSGAVAGAGFDKFLQFSIVSRGLRIAFAEKAIVYDEKTANQDLLVKQRARWISTWIRYFSLGFTLVGKGLHNVSLNQFLFGLVLLRPPLFIFLILSVLLAASSLFISSALFLGWVLGFICFVAGFVISLVKSNADQRIIRSLYGIPGFVFHQLRALVQASRPKTLTVATRGEEQKTESK